MESLVLLILLYTVLSAAIRDINGLLQLCERLYGYYMALKARKNRELPNIPKLNQLQAPALVSPKQELKYIQGSFRMGTKVRPADDLDILIFHAPHHGSTLKKA